MEKTLPFMATLSLPSFLISCGGDDPLDNVGGCENCASACQGGCKGGCSGGCEDSCKNTNTGSSSCSDCSAVCKNDCEGTCSENCQENCNSSCNNTSTNDSGNGTAVDLGLSVLWASYNVGATSVEEFGGSYYWGSTPEISYEEKKELISNTQIMDICGTKYDIAHYYWEDDWRLPTNIECRELVEQCSFTYEEKNGISGYVAKGPNGNSIFFPAQQSNGIVLYMSGVQASVKNENVHVLVFDRNVQLVQTSSIYSKYSVRPVKDGGSGCKDCTIGCSKNCTEDCTNGCKVDCGSDCTESCQNFCAKNCSTICKEGCGEVCEGGCTNDCVGKCQNGCRKACDNECVWLCTGISG